LRGLLCMTRLNCSNLWESHLKDKDMFYEESKKLNKGKTCKAVRAGKILITTYCLQKGCGRKTKSKNEKVYNFLVYSYFSPVC
jgi:hypothetical protein